MAPVVLAPRARRVLADYASDHQHPINQRLHTLFVPVIVVATLGLLSRLVLWAYPPMPLFQIDGGSLLLVAAGFWYFVLDWRLAMPALLLGAAAYFLGKVIPLQILLAMFFVGWSAQIYGHRRFEGRSPTLVRNLLSPLVAHLWWTAKFL